MTKTKVGHKSMKSSSRPSRTRTSKGRMIEMKNLRLMLAKRMPRGLQNSRSRLSTEKIRLHHSLPRNWLYQLKRRR